MAELNEGFCVLPFCNPAILQFCNSFDSPSGCNYNPANVPTINELFNLKDRVAIVTGGSRGLGLEIAEGLAEAGARLMLCARRDEWLAPTVADFRGRGVSVEGALC